MADRFFATGWKDYDGYAVLRSYGRRDKDTWSAELPATPFHAVVLYSRKPAVRMLRFDWLKILHVLSHPFACLSVIERRVELPERPVVIKGWFFPAESINRSIDQQARRKEVRPSNRTATARTAQPTAGIFWIVTVFVCRSRVKIRGQTDVSWRAWEKENEGSDAILTEKLEERKNNLCQPYSIKRYPVTLQDWFTQNFFLAIARHSEGHSFSVIGAIFLARRAKENTARTERMEVRTRTEFT